MKKDPMMKILACPMDKRHPLTLYEFRCSGGRGTVVEEGLLVCPKCNRFYPIREGIPVLLPDALRDKEEDLEFLRLHKKGLPGGLLSDAKPWGLVT